VAEVAVTNASPLILLSRAGKLNLLRLAADRILVPEPVAHLVANASRILGQSLFTCGPSPAEQVVVERPKPLHH